MPTDAQIIANHTNSLASTGPKSEEGKAVSSRNAFRHGLRANSIVFPDESRDQFEAFAAEMLVQLSPEGLIESQISHRVVAGYWRLRRAIAIEREIFLRLGCNAPQGKPPEFISQAYAMLQDGRKRGRVIEKMTRYEAHVHRLLRRDLQDLLALQSLREKQSPSQTNAPPLPPALDPPVTPESRLPAPEPLETDDQSL